MRLINQSVETWCCGYTLPEIWAHIAKCARVCYQSKPCSNGETDEEFIKRVILRNHSFDEIAKSRELQLKLHLSVLEHGTLYFVFDLDNIEDNALTKFFNNNKYSKVNIVNNIGYTTTNMRVIVENDFAFAMQYICKPCDRHNIRHTFNVITDLGIARDFNRHTVHSISEESTRYCNYTNKKFGGELQFIKPDWLDIPLGEYMSVDGKWIYTDELGIHKEYVPTNDDIYTYLSVLNTLDAKYCELIEKGWTPQQARQILPLSTKVQTVHTAFNTDWYEFLKLRAYAYSGSVHPNMKVIADKIKTLMAKENAAL